MSQQRNQPQPPRSDQSSDFQDDPLAYLEQGAVVPPRRPLQLRRTTSRRGFVGVGVAAIGAAAWFGVPLNTEGAFHPGTQVAGLNIAELNRPQAKTLMRMHFADFENTAVDYTFEQQHWNASLAQLGFAIDYDATLDAAWQNGRTASRTAQFKSVFLQPEVKSFPLIFSSDPEQLQVYLQDLGTQIVGAARDAALYLDGDQVRIRPNEDGRALDIDAAAAATNRVVQSAQRSTVELTAQPVVSQITAERLDPKRQLAQTMINASIRIDTGEDLWTVSQSTLRAALVLPPESVLADPTLDENIIGQTLDEMATVTYREPANATLGWDGGLVVVEADVRGRELDIEATASAVASIAQQSTDRVVSAVFTEKLAEVNSDQLDSLGIIDLVAEGDSNFDGSSWERAENVRVSAQHLNHTLVKPGETYSFLDSIGMITEVNGFVPGKIIRGGWYVSDIGGGACQASTTVFRAALKAGFPIKHQYHSQRLTMYEHDGWPPGLDAAIYQPNEGSNDWPQDLTFVNTTDNWLLVEVITDDVHAFCRIYGTPQGWDVDVQVPFISEPKKPGDPVETETDKLAQGQREQVGWAKNGYDVQAMRTIRANGELVQFQSQSNPWEFWSYFDPQRDEFLIGPGTPRQFTDKESTPES